MVFPLYFNVVTSESAFRARFDAEGRKTLAELADAAASNWKRDHLFAYRVIRLDRQTHVLPLLGEFAPRPGTLFPAEIRKFVDGPKAGLAFLSEHSLVRDPECGQTLGQVWAAMARFDSRQHLPGSMPSSGADDDADIAPGSRAKRARRNTIQDDFVDSSMLQIGSSSPLADGSLEASSVGYVDAESHSQLSFPEDETVRLISCALRHILYFGPPQDSPDCRIVVEFRDARTRLLALTPVLGRKLIATDDGGLCLRDGSDGLFTLSRDRVAILEAKRKFSSLIDGVPVISDDCFAQMTCEALVARLADPLGELHGNNVILINATQHYVCFLHFAISDEYIKDFETDNPTSFIRVTATPWFDLMSRRGREHVVINICAMMQWARVS